MRVCVCVCLPLMCHACHPLRCCESSPRTCCDPNSKSAVHVVAACVFTRRVCSRWWVVHVTHVRDAWCVDASYACRCRPNEINTDRGGGGGGGESMHMHTDVQQHTHGHGHEGGAKACTDVSCSSNKRTDKRGKQKRERKGNRGRCMDNTAVRTSNQTALRKRVRRDTLVQQCVLHDCVALCAPMCVFVCVLRVCVVLYMCVCVCSYQSCFIQRASYDGIFHRMEQLHTHTHTTTTTQQQQHNNTTRCNHTEQHNRHMTKGHQVCERSTCTRHMKLWDARAAMQPHSQACDVRCVHDEQQH